MGQQQLLLLVLSIVIVGTAIVVGINAYTENSVRTNWDSLLQEGLRIANDAQSWQQKPELFGGSPDAQKASGTPFNGIDFNKLGYNTDAIGTAGDCYISLNGTFEIEPSSDSLYVRGYNAANQNYVQLSVKGSTSGSINVNQSASARGGVGLDGSATTITPLTCTVSGS